MQARHYPVDKVALPSGAEVAVEQLMLRCRDLHRTPRITSYLDRLPRTYASRIGVRK